jgi:integrase
LTWDQVDMRRKLAWIGAGEAKGRKAIPVPLSRSALDALRAMPRPHTGLVFQFDGARLGSPKTGWNAAVRRAGITPARWHDLRHTWASWHVQAGTPLMVLKELGGWSSLEQVMIYAHLAPSHIARYADNARTA